MTPSCYGVHADSDGIWWLIQSQLKPQNAVGLKGIPKGLCKDLPRGRSPHELKLQEPVGTPWPFPQLSPIPKQDSDVFWVRETWSSDRKIRSLNWGDIVPCWSFGSSHAWAKALALSNIWPLVLEGVALPDMSKIRNVLYDVKQAPRRLILMGGEDVEDVLPARVQRLELPDWDETTDWQRVGVGVLTNWMRHGG